MAFECRQVGNCKPGDLGRDGIHVRIPAADRFPDLGRGQLSEIRSRGGNFKFVLVVSQERLPKKNDLQSAALEIGELETVLDGGRIHARALLYFATSPTVRSRGIEFVS